VNRMFSSLLLVPGDLARAQSAATPVLASSPRQLQGVESVGLEICPRVPRTRLFDADFGSTTERESSFVDAASFELMRALRIRDALAFDGDFSAARLVKPRAR